MAKPDVCVAASITSLCITNLSPRTVRCSRMRGGPARRTHYSHVPSCVTPGALASEALSKQVEAEPAQLGPIEPVIRLPLCPGGSIAGFLGSCRSARGECPGVACLFERRLEGHGP